jgi:cell division transport system permease protein
MYRFWQRALRDISANKFLNVITTVTIALSVLIVSAFGLLALNLNALMDKWRHGVRVLVYLESRVSESQRQALEDQIRRIQGVAGITFISKEEGLAGMKQRMRILETLLADLENNPLPDTFEVSLDAAALESDRIDALVSAIQGMPHVEEVTYGKVWLNRFTGLVHLARVGGGAMGGLFGVAAMFIVANTIRLVLYSRQQEIEIMRLIGASDRFIKAPFYMQGVIQGFFGGAAGLAALYGLFQIAATRIGGYLPIGFGHIRYFSAATVFLILGSAMAVGWIGCYLSLKGFLRR